MLTSVNWINAYLDPPASADEQAELLTRAGFPLEGREDLSGEDVRQDFEMTSNRGDCVCHVGLAREIAAISGRSLKLPTASPKTVKAKAAESVTVTNEDPQRCPTYTARIVRGVKVGPSPEWLADRLRSIDQIPRNNIVDASNFVLYELGQPTHCFDLDKLKGPAIIVRRARDKEPFLPIGEGAAAVKLTPDDLVIADAEDAVAIGGVKGGALTAVSDATTDLLIEAATFDPVAVRNTSRRHGIDSDSAYRFERGVPAGSVDAAADRLAELIIEIAGGKLADGVVVDGAALPKPRKVSMRPDRCRAILGMPVGDEQMITWLTTLGFAPRAKKSVIECTVPVHRLDIDREIDLIEEVGRMMGHDTLPVTDTLEVRVAPLQPTELARRAINDTLVGMGFVESITHSLVESRDATPFLLPGAETLAVDEADATAGHSQAGSVLRPSLLPSLLRVLARNHDHGVRSLRVFESAGTFMMLDGEQCERHTLGLLTDVEGPDGGIRTLRGIVERIVELLAGPGTAVDVVPDETAAWYAPGAIVRVGGETIGRLGLVSAKVADAFGVDVPVAAAELVLAGFAEQYPPQIEAHALPSFPAVERDVSAVVEESVRWADLQRVVSRLDLEHLETTEYVAAYRGKQIGANRKSVTMRLRFRASDHTLVSESVDTQVNTLIGSLEKDLGAEIRR